MKLLSRNQKQEQAKPKLRKEGRKYKTSTWEKNEIEQNSHNQPTNQTTTTTTTTTKAIKELLGKINIMTTHLSNMA